MFFFCVISFSKDSNSMRGNRDCFCIYCVIFIGSKHIMKFIDSFLNDPVLFSHSQTKVGMTFIILFVPLMMKIKWKRLDVFSWFLVVRLIIKSKTLVHVRKPDKIFRISRERNQNYKQLKQLCKNIWPSPRKK